MPASSFSAGLSRSRSKRGNSSPPLLLSGRKQTPDALPHLRALPQPRAPLGGAFLPTVTEQVVYGNAEIIRQFRKVLDVRAAFPLFPFGHGLIGDAQPPAPVFPA